MLTNPLKRSLLLIRLSQDLFYKRDRYIHVIKSLKLRCETVRGAVLNKKLRMENGAIKPKNLQRGSEGSFCLLDDALVWKM